MKRRNPLMAGLLNMLIPGSSHLYISGDWGKFILFFFVYGLALVVAILVGNNIQNIRQYTLPQGVCTGVLVLGVLGFLFYSGMKEASNRDKDMDSAAHYRSLRTDTSKDGKVEQLANLQRLRDDGLISNEEQEAKKSEIESKGE